MPRRPKKPNESKATYRNPPEAHRFKPGQSGNPAGRPPGIRSLARELETALLQTTTIRVCGRPTKVTKLKAMTRKLADLAAGGDARIVRLLLDQLREADARAAEEPPIEETFSAADREVIAALIARIGGKRE